MALDVLRLLWLIHVPYSLESLHISSAMYITSLRPSLFSLSIGQYGETEGVENMAEDI